MEKRKGAKVKQKLVLRHYGSTKTSHKQGMYSRGAF